MPILFKRSGLAAALLLGMAGMASASVGGTPLAELARWEVQGSANTTGASLMVSDGFGVNTLLLNDAAANLTGVPVDAEVVGAWLFWSGSARPMAGADNTVSLRLPNGTTFNNLSTTSCAPGESPCDLSRNRCVTQRTPTIGIDFFFCRRDITGLLRNVPGTQVGGTYTVGGVDADPGRTLGLPGSCDPSDPNCQAKYAGWSMVAAWQSPSATTVREAVLFDGFLFADEDFGIPGGGSGISNFFTISGFNARANARAELSLFAVEGDRQLGVPPQSIPGNPLFCTTCFDFLEVRTPSHPALWRVTDGTNLNEAGNLFNSSNKNGGDSVGVDVDSINIGVGGVEPVINAGDSSLTFRVGSGDGAPGGDNGGGELFFLGYLFVALDTDAPRLANAGTFKSASITSGAPGDLISYTIRVSNDGAANATNVRVADSLPPNTTYVANSTTTTCGAASGDVGGTSPLFQPGGLNLGTINFAGATRFCEVRFQVRISPTAPTGTITNTANIGADSIMSFPVSASTTVVAPTLTRFEKTVTGDTGGFVIPGQALTYTLTVFGHPTATISGVTLRDVLNANLQGGMVTARPMGSTLVSDASTGTVQVGNITVPAGGQAVVTFTATVRASAADGTVIPNQGALTYPAGSLNSDNPATGTAADSTNVTVRNNITLTTSTKTVVSPSPAQAQPGTVIRWRVRAINSGNRTATVSVADSLPLHVGSCTIASGPMGVACQPGGTNGTGQVTGTFTLNAGQTQDIEFTATVLGTAPDNFALVNSATLTPAENTTRAVTVTAPAVTVINRAVLTTSAKTLLDVNGAPARPTDVIRYTITVTNTGNRAATGVTVVDDLNARLQVVTVGQGGTATGQQLRWTSAGTPALASLAPNASVTLTAEVRVAAGTPNGTVISNTAVIDSNETTPFTTPAVSFTVTATPVLTLQKTVVDTTPAPFRPGDTVRYTLTLTNTGDGDATNVVLQDPLPAQLTFVSANNGGTAAGGTVTWNLGTVGLGAMNARTVTVDARINTPLDNGTSVSNQANVRSAEVTTPVQSDDPAVAGNANPTVFTVTSAAVLALTKTVTDVNGGDTLPGEEVRYTLTLTNTGDAPARNTVITDAVDARLNTLVPENGGTAAGQTLTWSPMGTPALAAVNPGTPVTVNFRARVVSPLANGTVIPNQANAVSGMVSRLSDDPGTAAANDPTVLTIRSIPILVSQKTVTNLTTPGTVFRPGNQVAYDITLRNTGTENATNIVVQDPLPAELTSITVTGGTLTGSTARFDRNSTAGLASLAPNASITLRITGNVVLPLDNGTVVSNQATTTADTLAPVLSDDPATMTPVDPTRFTVTSSVDLVATKTVVDVNGGSTRPGDAVRYTLVIRNNGTANARDVVITDPVDARLLNPVASNGGVVGGGGIRWDRNVLAALATLSPTQSVTVTFDATVASPLDDGTLISNQARITGTGFNPAVTDDPNTPAANDPTVIRVTSAADLAATTKEILNAAGTRITEATPGEALRWRITVRNTGTAVARNVTVTDALPAQWTGAAATAGGTVAGNTVTWTPAGTPALVNVAPGDAVVLDITGSLSIPLDNGTVVGNQAQLAPQGATPFVSDDPATATVGDQTRVVVRSAPVLTGQKTFTTADGAPVEPGEQVTWTLTFNNTGTAIARNVVVTDVLDASLEFISATGGGTLAGSTVTWNAGTITPGMPAAFTLVTRVRNNVPSGTVVRNQGSVVASGLSAVVTDDPSTPATNDATQFTVQSQPRLVLQKALPAGASREVVPEQDITYALTVQNAGSALATGVTVRDEVPVGVTFVSASNGGTFDEATRTVTWNAGDLAPFGGQAVLTLVVRVDDSNVDGTVLQNRGFARGANVMGETASDDPATPAANDSTDVTVRSTVDLAGITKTVVDENGGQVLAGDVLRYTVTIRNAGTAATRNVTVTDAVGANLELLSAESGGVLTGNTVTWSQAGTPVLARLRPSDGAVALVFRARVRAGVEDGTVVPNVATVRSLEVPAGEVSDDPATPAPRDPTAVRVSAPRLSLLKAVTDVDGPPAIPGDRITYTLTLRNQGSAPASGVTMEDPLPAELQDITLSNGGTLSGQQATWAVGTLAAGAEATFTVNALVNPAADGMAVVVNRAVVRAAEVPVPVESDDPATPAPDATTLRLQGRPSLVGSTITIDGNPTEVRPRDPIRFTLTLVNSGNSPANGVSVDATLDGSLDNVVVEDGGVLAGPQARWDASGVPALARLAPGARAVIHVRATVRTPLPDGITISQAATARAVNADAVTLGPVTVRVDSRPRFSASTLEVTDQNSGEVEPGDLLTWRFTILNDGSAVGRNVTFSLPVPSSTRYVPGTATLRGAPLADITGSVFLGDMEPGQAVIATMQVRVATDTPRGLALGTQGWVNADDLSAVPSDDPRTPEIPGDATRVVVGGGSLVNALLVAQPAITSANGRTTLRLAIENQGSRPATDVLVVIPEPADAQYVPRTLTVSGMPATDEADGDAAGIENGGWYVRVPLVESGQAVVATVNIALRDGRTRAEYQGTLTRPGTNAQQTDGDPASPGTQTTVVMRPGAGPDITAANISVVDVNGGVALPGDVLQYTVVVPNRGSADAVLAQGNGLIATYDPNLQLVPDSLEPAALFRSVLQDRQVLPAEGAPAFTVKPGENLVLRFRASIIAGTASGTAVSTFAIATLGGGAQQIGPAVITVGSLPGTSTLRGVVWQDTDGNNNRRDVGVDQVFEGWQVLLVAADAGPRAQPIRSAITDEQGRYALDNVAPGAYRIRVTNRGGAQFGQYNVTGLQPGESRNQDLRIDPSGVIYDSHSGQPLAGVRVTLFEEDIDDNPANDRVVPADRLPQGQQDQVTGPDGRYRFDPFAGRYRLELSGPQPTSVWPSGIVRPQNDDNSTHPFGSVARPDANGNVVPQPVPDARSPGRYYLRFNLAENAPPVLNNHVPVDPLLSHVRVVKQANKRMAHVGDIVTYSVRITNSSTTDMTVERMGGVEVADTVPPGFSYLQGTARMDRVTRDARGGVRRERLPAADPQGKRILTFGAYDLYANSEMELRYQLAVGPSVPFGNSINRALVRSAAGQQVVSNESAATVEIRPEMLFDDGTVLGKVFCDRNQDGWQDGDEEGVVGVRVALDTGFYAETDEHGRFHFTTVPPGTHLAKVDEQTIPPGGRFTTPLRQMFYVTRGLPSRFSFGVTCPTERVAGAVVTINEEAYPPDYVPPPPEDAGPPPPDQLRVTGVRSQRVVKLNGVPQETIRADLGVTFGAQDPLIGQGVGPNLMAFDAVKGLGLELAFHPRVKTSLPLAGWRLVVEDEDSHAVVHAVEGDGELPAVLPWDAREPTTGLVKLEAGHRYIATLAVVATNGDVGMSSPRRFGIAVGAEAQSAGHEAMIDESKGALFDRKNRPLDAVKAWVRDEAPKLGDPKDTQVTIEVHGDDKMKPADARLHAARAKWLKGQLQALGFDAAAIEVRTPGGDEPRLPNMGTRQRAQNRRLVMRSRATAVLGDPLAPVGVMPRVNINGTDVALTEEQVFETDIPARVGDVVRVDVTTDKGQRFITQRLYTGQPFAAGAPPPPGTAAVQLKGDVFDGVIHVNGEPIRSSGTAPVAATPDGDPAPFTLDGKGVPDRELALKLSAPAETVKWKLQFLAVPPPSAPEPPKNVDADGGPLPADADGGAGPVEAPDAGNAAVAVVPGVFSADDVVVFETEGEGLPPERFTWSGANTAGAQVLRAGLLRYRFAAELPDGVTLYAPDGVLAFTSRPEPITLQNPFTPAGKPTLAARMTVMGLAGQWKQVGGRVLITAHTDAGKPRMKALFETQALADAMKAAFVEAGVPEDAMDAQGRGFQEPVMAGTGPKAALANRRVEVTFMPPALEGVTLPVLPAALEVNGVPTALTGSAFSVDTYATRGRKLVVAWRDAAGRRTVVQHEPALPVVEQTPATLADVLGPIPQNTLLPLPAGYVMPGQEPPPAADFATWAGDADGGVDVNMVDGGAQGTVATSANMYWAPGGVALAMSNAPVVAPVVPVPGDGVQMLPMQRQPFPSNTADLLASHLVLDVPPDGARFGADRLLVRGITHPLNVVRVNGQEAVVDPATGRFTALVRLQEGTNSVNVETEDVRGNKGLITRRYELDTTGFFFMGMVDTATAAGARLDEFNQFTSISPTWTPAGGFAWRGGPITFYGRGAAYARGRWKGFWRIPFVEAQLHLDSSRWNQQAQELDLLGQLTYYPTFGDNGVQVQEARSRYPLYVRVKGGANEFFVGNNTSQLGYGELAKYGRARYGAMLTVDQGYGKLSRLGGVDLGHTRARVFVAGGDTPRRPAHVEMRGTGGSLYFLKDRFLVEGSERVYILVRDAITGSEISRRMLTRNAEYTVRYNEGRLWLNTPLMSVADASLISNTNPTSITNGNPVYLVVDYEHAGAGDFSEFGAGGAVEQTLLDHFSVGGMYTVEGRRQQQPSYQLMGVHARAFWDQDNYVQGEWAYSRAVNVDNAISNDGGLSWQQMGQGVNAGAVAQDGTIYPAERQGAAYKLKGQVALGRILWGKNPTDMMARAYFHRVQGGYYADGSLTDQGQWKYGTEAFWQFTKQDSVRMRWDGVWAEVPLRTQIPDNRILHRELGIMQLRHQEGPFTLTGEYAMQYMEDSRGFGRVNWSDFRRRVMNVVAGQVDFKINNHLTLLARQEGVLTADERILPRWNDRLITTVGTRLKLVDNVELSLMETVRWNGENATTLGVRTRVAENADIYAQQRFQMQRTDWVGTSVVGASNGTADGTRTYTEVQHDLGSRGEQTRGVLGASHNWTLLDGVTLQMGYERTQVLGSSMTTAGGGTTGPATANTNGTPVNAAFSDSYAFSQPGAVGANPQWIGSGSRDAFFAQMNFAYFKWLKFSSRWEVRYDNQDESRGGRDRLMFFTQNNLAWNWTDDLTFIGRFNLADVQNKTLNIQEAALREVAAGLAYRPVRSEWLSVLAMYRHRMELRPIMLAEGRFERTTADVLSIEPIVELPFGLQLVEKVAFKYSREKVDDVPEGNAFMGLWINRLNYHAFRLAKRFVPQLNRFNGDIDLAIEYRIRALITQNQVDHGFVTEIGIVPVPFVRIGAGFNFSRVSDDVFAKNNQNAFGPYLRMQAQY